MDRTKCIEAISALQKYLEKKSQESRINDDGPKNLLDNDDEDSGSNNDSTLQLLVTTRKYVVDRKDLKPKVVFIPHSLYNNSDDDEKSSIYKAKPSVCLLVKDPQRAFKDVLLSDESQTKDIITRIVGVSKLKGKFKPYEARRQLLNGYDIFLSDDRVITTLPKLLGVKFYSSFTKIPLPISISDNKTQKPSSVRTKNQIDKVLHSTWFTLSPSTLIVVRVGYRDFKPEEVADNIEAVINYITKSVIKNGFDGVRALHIKTSNSTTLPIYLSDKIYGDEDIAEENELEEDNKEEKKRKRNQQQDQPHKLSKLEQALAEVIDEEDLAKFTNKKHGNKKQKEVDEGKNEVNNEKKETTTKKETETKKPKKSKKSSS